MSRKSILIKQCQSYTMGNRRGSPRMRRERKRVLYALVNDLIYLGIAPPSFEKLNITILQSLVDFWQSKSLSTITISNRIGILRKFVQSTYVDTIFPDNAELGILYKPRVTNQPRLALPIIAIYENINSPITKLIIDLQINFGLTKMEAIRMNLMNAGKNVNKIYIDRKIAWNNHDRYIPICTKKQRLILNTHKELLGSHDCIAKIATEQEVSIYYKIDCALKKIPHDFPYRSHYAKYRFNCLSKTLAENVTINRLKNELGIMSNKKMKGLLYDDCKQ